MTNAIKYIAYRQFTKKADTVEKRINRFCLRIESEGNDFITTYRRFSMLKMGPNKARKGDRRLTFTRQGGWGLFYRCMCYLKYQPFLSLSLFYSLVLARNMEHTVTIIIIHTRCCMYNQPLLLHNTMIGSRQLKVFNYYMEGENVLWWKIRDRADGPNVRYNTVTKI